MVIFYILLSKIILLAVLLFPFKLINCSVDLHLILFVWSFKIQLLILPQFVGIKVPYLDNLHLYRLGGPQNITLRSKSIFFKLTLKMVQPGPNSWLLNMGQFRQQARDKGCLVWFWVLEGKIEIHIYALIRKKAIFECWTDPLNDINRFQLTWPCWVSYTCGLTWDWVWACCWLCVHTSLNIQY